MPITERSLKQWRKEALEDMDIENINVRSTIEEFKECYKSLQERILRMTQELLDQHLLRRK